MKTELHLPALLSMFALLGGLAVVAQSQAPAREGFADIDLPGRLELVDLPPDSTPVDALTVSLYSPEKLTSVTASPNPDGTFVLKHVRPGRYALDLPVPARIRSFTSSSRPLNPQGFEVEAGDAGPLRVVLSYKTSSLFVDVQGMSSDTKVVALLFPDDPYLTRPQSGNVTPVSDGHAAFPYTPPGRYLLFAVDSLCQDDVAFHPRLRTVLAKKVTRIDVVENGDTRTTARYLDRGTLHDGIVDAAPDQASPEGKAFYLTPLRCQ